MFKRIIGVSVLKVCTMEFIRVAKILKIIFSSLTDRFGLFRLVVEPEHVCQFITLDELECLLIQPSAKSFCRFDTSSGSLAMELPSLALFFCESLRLFGFSSCLLC